MREIKFRGWRRKYQEWMTGYLVIREEPYLHDIIQPIGDNSSVTGAVERDSVGQYTGLKDKNDGKGVFAGDVVNIHIFVLGVDPGTLGAYEDEQEFINVEIKHGNPFDGDIYVPAFYFEYGEEIILLSTLPLHEESVEVIGNIYENPELLEEAPQ